MSRRILVFGPTGVQKQTALANLRKDLESRMDISSVAIIDLDERYIPGGVVTDYSQYLGRQELDQRGDWLNGWQRFIRDYPPNYPGDIILSLHGTITRPFYGIRSPVSISALREFGATAVVTLIDDVYGMWYRTEQRGIQRKRFGKPSMEELISARRSEILIADFVAHHLSPPLRNTVVAVRHPASMLSKLLFGSTKVHRVYSSFPISAPRRMMRRGDFSGYNAINDFLTNAYMLEKMTQNAVVFCPLTIDELPLRYLLTDEMLADLRQDEKADFLVPFSLADRWDVREFYGSDLLLTDDTVLPEVIQLHARDVWEILGNTAADVRTRDYRLTRQADALAVFSPVMEGQEVSKGVRNEIQSATEQGKRVEVFQDLRFDPQGFALSAHDTTAGALGTMPDNALISYHPTLQAMLEAAILDK